VSAGVAVVCAAASGSANRDLAIIIDSARSPHTLTAETGGVAVQRGTHCCGYSTINYPINTILDWHSVSSGVGALF